MNQKGNIDKKKFYLYAGIILLVGGFGLVLLPEFTTNKNISMLVLLAIAIAVMVVRNFCKIK